MSTVHLTAQEKRNLKIAAEAEAIAVKRAKREKRVRREMEKIEKAERLQMAMTNPDPALAKWFGPEAYGEDATGKRRGVVPGQKFIPYDSANMPPEVPPDTFIEELARQPDFKEKLGENIEDVRIARFLKMIGEIENRSMTSCARACGLSNSDMARIWRNTTLARAFFRIVKRMEPLADKVVDDAMGKTKSCPRCDGFGRVEVPEYMQDFFEGEKTAICPNCEGTKVVPVVGSAPDKQLIWEKIGWSKQKGGVSVSVNMADHMVDATMGDMDGIEGEVLEHQ